MSEEELKQQELYLTRIKNYIDNQNNIELNDNDKELLIKAINNFHNLNREIKINDLLKLKETFASNVEPKVNSGSVESKSLTVGNNESSETFDITNLTNPNNTNNDSTELSAHNKKVMERALRTNPKINVDLTKYSKLNDSMAKEINDLKLQQDSINELMRLKRSGFDKSKQEIYDKTNTIIEDTNNAINSGNFNREAQSNVLLTRIYGRELTANLNHIKPLKSILDEFNQHPTRENAVKLRNAFFEKRDMQGQVVDPNNQKQQNTPYLDGSSYIQNVDDFDSKLNTLVQGNKFKKDTQEWQEEQQKLDSVRDNVTGIINDRVESIEMKQKTVSFANENIETALKAQGIHSFSKFEVDSWEFDRQKNEWSQIKINILDDIIDLDEKTISKKLDAINKKNLEYYESRPGALVTALYNSLQSRNEIEAMKSKYGVLEYISMYKAVGMSLELTALTYGIGQSIFDLIKTSNKKREILKEVAELKKSLNTEDYLQKKNDLVAVDVTKKINTAFEEALKKDPSLTLEQFLLDENNKEILEKLGINKDEFLIIHNVVSKNAEHKDLFNDLFLNNGKILTEYGKKHNLNNKDINLYLNAINNKEDLEKLKNENPELIKKIVNIQNELKEDVKLISLFDKNNINSVDDLVNLEDKENFEKYKTIKDELKEVSNVLETKGLTLDDMEDYFKSQNILSKINQVKTLDTILKEVNEIENKNVDELNEDLENLNNNFKKLLAGDDKNINQHEFLNLHIQKYKDVLIEFKNSIDETNKNGFKNELEAINACEEHNVYMAKAAIYQLDGKELDAHDKLKLETLETLIRGAKNLDKDIPISDLYDIKEELARKEEIISIQDKYKSLSKKLEDNIQSMDDCDKKFGNSTLEKNEKDFKKTMEKDDDITQHLNSINSTLDKSISSLFLKPELEELIKNVKLIKNIDKRTDIRDITEVDDDSKKIIVSSFIEAIDKFKDSIEQEVKQNDKITNIAKLNNLNVNEINNAIDSFTKDKLQEALFSMNEHPILNVLSKTVFMADKLDDVLFELKPENLSISKENLQKIQDLKTLRLSIQKGLNDNNDKDVISIKDLLNVDLGNQSKITEYNKSLRALVNSDSFESFKNLLPQDLQDDCLAITKTMNFNAKEKTIELEKNLKILSDDKQQKVIHAKSEEVNKKIEKIHTEAIEHRKLEKDKKDKEIKELENKRKAQMASQQNKKPEEQTNEQENINGIDR